MNLLNNYPLLAELAKDIAKPRYASELAKALKLNQKSVSNALHTLEKEKILKSRLEGKNRVFFFNGAVINRTKATLCVIEAEKRRIFLADTKMNMLIEELSKAIKGVYLVFGSYAKGLATERSDLDILVIGNHEKSVVDKLERIYRVEINIRNLSETTFNSSGKKGEILIKEIARNHIVIRGIDFFTDAFTTWNQPPGV